MNKEHLLELANRIENHKDHHLPAMNMDTWFKDTDGEHLGFYDLVTREDYVQDHLWCGTTACIAGHAAIMQKDAGVYVNPERVDEFSVAEWLDLTSTERFMLFRGHKHGATITAQDAAKVIRHFVETGKVDWGIVGAADDDIYDDDIYADEEFNEQA